MSFVLVEKPRPHVTQITLNRPGRMNAMAFEVMVPFKEALEEVSFDNDTRVVIVTGAKEAAQIGMISKCVVPEVLLEECYVIAERMVGFSQLGVEISKQMLWASMDAGSLHSHMNHEGHGQLFVRMTTKNFEEAIKARKEGRDPKFLD